MALSTSRVPSTTFSDLNFDCRLRFFSLIPLQERLRLRAVCRAWAQLIEESFKRETELRIFDSRQSMVDFYTTLGRQSLHQETELTLGERNTLILSWPPPTIGDDSEPSTDQKQLPEERPSIDFSKLLSSRHVDPNTGSIAQLIAEQVKYESLRLEEMRTKNASKSGGALFLSRLFPNITNLVLWSDYFRCMPNQFDIPGLLGSWSTQLTVLSLRFYGTSGFPCPESSSSSSSLDSRHHFHLTIELSRLRSALISLTRLKYLHLGEVDPRGPEHSSSPPPPPGRYVFPLFLDRSIIIPRSVDRVSLYNHQSDHGFSKQFTGLDAVPRLDVTYFYNSNLDNSTNPNLFNDHHFFLDELVDFKCTTLQLDIAILAGQKMTTTTANPRPRIVRLPLEQVLELVLTDRLNYLHSNTREMYLNAFNYTFHGEIFELVALAFPNLKRLVMGSKFAAEAKFKRLIEELVKEKFGGNRSITLKFIQIKSANLEDKVACIRRVPWPKDQDGSSAEAFPEVKLVGRDDDDVEDTESASKDTQKLTKLHKLFGRSRSQSGTKSKKKNDLIIDEGPI